MRIRLAAAVIAAVLIPAAPALATSNSYYVAGTGDPPNAGCVAYPNSSSAFRCDSLRAAVDGANGNPNADGESDLVWLQAAGTYQLALGQLGLTGPTTIFGRGPRTTTIQGDGTERVFEIEPGAEVSLWRVKIAGGRATGDIGGDILNYGSLFVLNSWVRDGSAGAGGGIANIYPGQLALSSSLVEGNAATTQGGGILNDGGGQGAQLELVNTTVTANSINAGGFGGGIASRNGPNTTELIGVTIARNLVAGDGTAGGGVGIAIVSGNGGTVTAQGSLFAANFSTSAQLNCNAPVSEISPGSNVEDQTTCSLQRGFQSAIGLGASLTDQGGDTDVLAIAAQPVGNGGAKGAASPCISSTDQRGATRNSSACDAGAFEQGAVAPAIDSSAPADPVFAPPPPPPAPTATPTPAPVATPVAQQSVAGQKVSGTVLVKKPGGKGFVALDPTQPIPLGSTIDVTHGTIKIIALQKKGAKPETAEFFDGQFKITQTKTTTDLTLNQTLASCGKGAKAAASKPKTRKLWGNGTGSFRTRGQYSAATVRGTRWLVQDSCAGTLTRVKTGVVSVHDNVKNKTILLKAGRTYLAKPRR